jgi:hypothetical protein
LENGQGRLGVIYSPYDMCCRWHQGGTRAKPVFDVGTNIFYYVDKVASKTAAKPPAEETPPPVAPPAEEKPETPKPPAEPETAPDPQP